MNENITIEDIEIKVGQVWRDLKCMKGLIRTVPEHTDQRCLESCQT
jgi:hypothetical protein